VDHSTFLNQVILWSSGRNASYKDDYERAHDLLIGVIKESAYIKTPSKTNRYYVCSEGNRVEGIMALSFPFPKVIQIDRLISRPENLLPSSRVKGVGTALINQVFHILLKRHLESICLQSVDTSGAFYAKMGFTQIGKHPFYRIGRETVEKRFADCQITAPDLK